ncbi:Mitochondrial inner membrane protease atp23 [Tulasnella sp. UAMH 9824]|nr:Mitochondrial inner membrane protease atp23 [Tulasnella sp. UAMH 9824]
MASSGDAPSSSSTAPDAQDKDLKAFDRWRKSVSWITGVGLTPEDQARRKATKDAEAEEAMWVRCEKWKADLMKNSPAVTFMLKHLQQAGCNLTTDHIHCQPCNLTRAGGFSPEKGILLCQDGFWSKNHMEDTLVHEMVHMYDHVKFKVDWKDLRHHACSEDCVRRRAILSVQQHPDCAGDVARAEKAVNEVWESCKADTRPFDEIY